MVKTVEQSVALSHDECPCLLRLAHESQQSHEEIITLLSAHLLALNQFLNLKNGMDSEEIIFTAESIVDEFGGALTFADINIVLTAAKRGKYGKMYERLSCAQVMDWFRNYYSERMEAAERLSIHQAREEKSAPLRMTAEIKEVLLPLVEKRTDNDIEDERHTPSEGEFKKQFKTETELDLLRLEVAARNIMRQPEETRTERENECLRLYEEMKEAGVIKPR